MTLEGKGPTKIEADGRFLGHLANILAITNHNNAELAIVGGIALRAILGQAVESRRSNGTITDIDAIGIGPSSAL
jgi:hypothetical protein